MENFKRVPTAEADIRIEPGDTLGESDVVITWKQAFPLRLTLSANDGGSEATGKRLGSVTVSGDHLLTLNDLFYASVNHDLGGGRPGERGTRGHTIHYAVPFGYWTLDATSSTNRYHQSVAGASQTYLYSGTSENHEIKLSRLVYRDAAHKTMVSLRGYLTKSNNFIDDTEVEVQRRRMAGWEAGIGQRIQQPDGSYKDNQIVTGKDAAGKTTSRDATAADKVGGINLSISVGSSRSQSTSATASDTATGSTVAAGGNIAITASGAGQDSDLLIQGSKVLAGKNVAVQAEDELQLLAAQNTSEQHSKNKNSSASVGFSVGTNGLTFNVGASAGKGKSDGDDLTHSNTVVQAGNQLTVKSGSDTTLQGAVASAEQITVDVGDDLLIESLQDSSSFKSKQQNAGFSLSVGAGQISGSVSVGGSKIDADYQSVNEQSSLRAGDGGFDVAVGGDTTLVGGAITSTDKAVQEGKNRITTVGELKLADLQNKASYDADSYGVSLGAGTSFDGKLVPAGTGAGIGSDAGDAASTTQAGISGIAGNQAARTGDAETGLKKIFDQEKVQKDIDAQVQITQTFGQQASKAVGDYATGKMKEAQALRAQGKEDEANALEAQWSDTGTLRLAAHTVIGGLTGGASGAAGAAAGTLTAPAVADALKTAGLDGPLATTLTALASTTVGAAVGGTTGAATAFNEVTNNYLTHREDNVREALKKRKQGGQCDTACEGEIKRLDDLDVQRDKEIQGLIDICKEVRSEANCSVVSRHYAEVNGYGFASAKFESEGRTGSPFSFNGRLKTTEAGEEYYAAPQIRQADGSYAPDPGGLSYGPFQLSANRGGMKEFLDYLKNQSFDSKDFYDQLDAAGGLEAAQSGKKAFVDKFMELTKKDPQFAEYQFESINQSAIKRVTVPALQKVGVDFDTLSTGSKEAIFSIVVHNGPNGADKAIDYVMSVNFAQKEQEYQKSIAEGKNLITQREKLITQREKLIEQEKKLIEQKNALNERKIVLLESKERADAATLRAIERQIAKLDQQTAKLNQQVEAKNKRVETQSAEVTKISAKVDANDGLIQGIRDWMKEVGDETFRDEETFITKLYQWRIDKRPTEAESRFIPERDIVLDMLRERQGQDGKK